LKGDLRGAETAFVEAARLAPNLSLAAVGHARVQLAQGNLEEAAQGLSDSVVRFPTPEAVILLAETLAAQRRQAEADVRFDLVRTIARLQEDSGQVVDLEMARFEADHGDPARALSLARKAYRTRPTVHAADTLGWALFRSGRPGTALPRIEEALRLRSLDPVLHHHAAAIFFANGQANRAADELGVALAHRFTLSPPQLEEALTLAAELEVAVPGLGG
jgi:tetratricopeptide (TPR) repeat protein